MDPNATLAILDDSDATCEERKDALVDLVMWARKGGFLPKMPLAVMRPIGVRLCPIGPLNEEDRRILGWSHEHGAIDLIEEFRTYCYPKGREANR